MPRFMHVVLRDAIGVPGVRPGRPLRALSGDTAVIAMRRAWDRWTGMALDVSPGSTSSWLGGAGGPGSVRAARGAPAGRGYPPLEASKNGACGSLLNENNSHL